jgi:hypothetical protein
MSYMDKEGYLKKDYKDSDELMLPIQKVFNTALKRGATIPEAAWELHCLCEAVINGARDDMMEKRLQKRAAKRRKSK